MESLAKNTSIASQKLDLGHALGDLKALALDRYRRG
jgi:hypothetical protein